MLQLLGVTREYEVGDSRIAALRGIDITFRKSEFVSILGPSGSGKTTLLNIIGGLDQYTAGDLVINGKSTKEFRDADWDAYRNHSIGFVFQTYNLIPHQSVLANVELALTLSGVSKSERRRRSLEALAGVGLADQAHKKPSQLSGGQMQRVAIARALVNNPDIVLADEPTGALDSETSVQVMELLKAISRDRLVIMVTHNPALAERYSTRIVRLLDGRITEDSMPYDAADEPAAAAQPAYQKPSMSFFRALSLSLRNLMTKKARTILTCFAGSIGIIGIALVLSVSTGFQTYIDRVQEDTLASYPITIEAESVDMTSLLTSLMQVRQESESTHEDGAIYESAVMADLMNALTGADVTKNNLSAFADFLESDAEIRDCLSAVRYSYGLNMHIYTRDADDAVAPCDPMLLFAGFGAASAMQSQFSSYSSYEIWEELLAGDNGGLIHDTVLSQYEIVAGRWPESYDEAVLIIGADNEVSDLVLYALGLRTGDEMREIMRQAMAGEAIDTGEAESWSYDEILGRSFRMLLDCELYQKNADGSYVDLSETEAGLTYLYENEQLGTTLHITGILRAGEDASASMTGGSIGYTHALTETAVQRVMDSEIIVSQLADPDTDVLTGLPFESDAAEHSEAEKAAAFRAYAEALDDAALAALAVEILSVPSDGYLDAAVAAQLAGADRAQLEAQFMQAYAASMGLDDTSAVEAYFAAMDDESFFAMAEEGIRESILNAYAEQMQTQLAGLSENPEALRAAFALSSYTDAECAVFYDRYMPSGVSESTYEENLALLGYVNFDTPTSIDLYAASFEDKDSIAACISRYNETASEEDQISYTDYVALLMSSVTTIINAIAYVLMAFVAISLVVSSIMIGIITYISVLERTKEIGILRAVGASKKDVSRVFNAETVIVGLLAGLLGIAISLLLLLPINLLLHQLTGIATLSAILPVTGAVILVLISVVLTFIAGLIPSGIAARKNPVEALRTE